MHPRRTAMLLISGLERGGTELRLLELARRLPGDIALHVCATTAQVALRPAFEAAGARVSVIPVERPWLDWRAVRAVARCVQDSAVDVLNTFDLKGALIANAVRRLVKPRPLLVHHQVDLLFGLSAAQRGTLRWLMQHVDAIVCDANTTVETVFGDHRPRVPLSVIPNGVDSTVFAPDPTARKTMRRALGMTDAHFLLGTVANFRPEKNHRLLIEAFAALHHELPQLRLLLVGGGELLEEVRGLTEQRGLSHAVTFTGSVDGVRDYLAAMDAFILPSLRDAFSNAVLQAMAMGVPCACARTGEYRTVMQDDRHGLLFDPTDAHTCVTAIRRLVVDDALRERLAEEGHAIVERRYSTDVMVASYARFFRAIGTAAPPAT